MTDDEIRDVLVELQRIGVDLGQPPGLAIGTGFPEGKLVPWLRSLPDNLGHDGFVAKLAAQIQAAAPNATGGDSAAHPYREYPTIEQLEAGTDVLISEWDPLGARLGELSRDDASPVSFTALTTIVANEDLGGVELAVAEILGMAEQEFGVRPSPGEQRCYLARRLIQVVRDHPAPAHENRFEETARMSTDRSSETKPLRSVVAIGPRGDEPPVLDPSAACTECGVTGTVAFVTRDSEPHVSRYCVQCWSTVRDRYWSSRFQVPKVDNDDPASIIRLMDFVEEKRREQVRSVGTAVWEDHFEFQKAAAANAENDAKREEFLRLFATNLARLAPQMYGPMPPHIEAFVTQYAERNA